ncbi:MAG: hypothetical protein M3072_05760 [Candidatus Dormibacteraeota bacterium]|nr:hypothetical protein [Candidatus Dormibacteraeota bacterium]
MNEDTKVQERIASTAAGGVAETTKAASHPRRTARNRVRRLERSRTPTARQARRQAAQLVTGAASATTALVNGINPSEIVFRGLGLMKSQARRRDLVGEAAYRALELLHNGLGGALRSLSRLQAASQPPARTRVSRSAASTRPKAARPRQRTSTASSRAAAPATAAGTPRKRSTSTSSRPAGRRAAPPSSS